MKKKNDLKDIDVFPNEDFSNFPLIELLIIAKKDLSDFFISSIETKKTNFNFLLEKRISSEEKIIFTSLEIKKIREGLENDFMNNIYYQFSQPLKNFFSKKEIFEKNISSISNDIPDEFSDFESVLKKAFLEKNEFDEKDISIIINQVEKSEEKSILLENVKKRKDVFESLICAVFYIYYENQYLQFLLEIYSDLVSISLQNENLSKKVNKEFTTGRQVLAIHFLLNEFDVYAKADKTEIARFIQFVTGKESEAKINDTNIYKRVKNPFSPSDKQLESDLQFIRIYFEKLGLDAITDKINKEIRSRDKNKG